MNFEQEVKDALSEILAAAVDAVEGVHSMDTCESKIEDSIDKIKLAIIREKAKRLPVYDSKGILIGETV